MKSIDTIRLRKTLGWLGMLLPVIVLVLCLIFQCVPGHLLPDSISQTYYFAPTITPFMIILGAASILLMCYRGYEKIDDIINTLTGIAGLCICLFPCSNSYLKLDAYVGTF
jgi:peptidoglycan/LPS O-acetylase OafA/YrhL